MQLNQTTLSLYSISGLFLAITSAVLLIILAIYGRSKLHRIWLFFNISICVWGVGAFFIGKATNYQEAIISWRFAFSGVIFIAVLFYHFTCAFCNINRRSIIIFAYLQGFFFFILNFTNLFLSKIYLFRGSILYAKSAGIYYPISVIIWVFLLVASVVEFILCFRKLEGLKRTQALYLIIGFSAGFLGGITNFLPVFGVNIYPYGNFSIPVYCIIATYAILRYRLLDARVVITNSVIFLLVYSLVLWLPFFIGYKYKLWQVSTWVMFVLASAGQLIFNYLRQQAEDRILEEQKRYRTTLDSASEAANRFKTVDEIIHHISKVYFKTVGIKNVAFYLRKGELLILNSTGTNEVLHQKEINNKQLIGYFVQRNQPVIIREMHENGHKNKQNINGIIKESQTEVAVPLVKSDSLVALILLGEKNDSSPYSDEDIKAFRRSASHLALAIENVQYLDEQKKINEEENKNRRQFQLDKLVSSMGHQIRNPLNVISGAMTGIEIVMKKYKSVIEQRYYNRLEEKKNEIMVACGGISTTINTILDYGRGTIELRRIKVNDILKEFNILTQMIIGKYMISPNVEIEKDVPDVFGDIHTINEILSTYFDNSCQAVEANEGAKKIDFKIYKMDGEYVRFEIADNGHGIDEDTQRAIFDVSTSTKGTKGHGFGLVSVRKACSQMKGTKYGFYSAGRGFGSKFWIDVPIATN